jgi:hypothetical protein
MSTPSYDWTDEARVIVWPPEHSAPEFAGSLAECVTRAVEIADTDPRPAKVEISHGRLGLIQIGDIRAMAADPSFPVLAPDDITIEDLEFGPMG